MARRPKKTFRISGRVIDRQDKQGLAGLRVEAWDKYLIFSDLVGRAMTNKQCGCPSSKVPSRMLKALARTTKAPLATPLGGTAGPRRITMWREREKPLD